MASRERDEALAFDALSSLPSLHRRSKPFVAVVIDRAEITRVIGPALADWFYVIHFVRLGHSALTDALVTTT